MARAILGSIRDVPADQVPARLGALCAEFLPVTGASISLMAETTARRILHASDPVAWQLAELQYTLGDGPCVHAYKTGAPVFATDLTRGDSAQRWPLFVPRALEAGAQAVFSFPLTIGAISAGTLDLYRDAPGSLSEPEVGAALLIADATTLGVLRLYAGKGETEYAEGNGDVDWLGGDTHHDKVHQATGMVMIQCDVGVEEALLILRARAFAHGTTLTALAHEVVARRVRFDGVDE